MKTAGTENALERIVDDLERQKQEFANWSHGLAPIPDKVNKKVHSVLEKAISEIQKIKQDLH